MNKKVAVGTMLVLCASPFFCAGLKKGKIESKKPEGAHGTVALIKASLQEWNPGPFKLADKEIDKLFELAESGDGNACWQLACYYYCNGEIEDYINYIRKGCDLIDLDCLYEIVDNSKNQIPCTEDERLFFMERIRLLGKNGNEDAMTYWNLLNVYEKYRNK
ncbi:MAG: hypothetical protein IKP60_00595 [Treponema sp.]|nr:hypothetical protein [Treponema sp.]